MPHDPELVAETREWLLKARTDIRVGLFELTATPPFSEDAAVHSQQAVGKSLKGYLLWHGRVFRKTHNLVELGEACVELDRTLEPLLRRAAPLTEYAWRYRYPGDSGPIAPETAHAALELAQAVHSAILGRLPAEAHP